MRKIQRPEPRAGRLDPDLRSALRGDPAHRAAPALQCVGVPCGWKTGQQGDWRYGSTYAVLGIQSNVEKISRCMQILYGNLARLRRVKITASSCACFVMHRNSPSGSKPGQQGFWGYALSSKLSTRFDECAFDREVWCRLGGVL